MAFQQQVQASQSPCGAALDLNGMDSALDGYEEVYLGGAALCFASPVVKLILTRGHKLLAYELFGHGSLRYCQKIRSRIFHVDRHPR